MADLTATILLLNDPSPTDRPRLAVDFRNNGSTIATGARYSIVLSTDQVIDHTDTVLFTQGAFNLGAGAGLDLRFRTDLPENLTDGTYFLGVISDRDNTVAETNEANNTAVTRSFFFDAPDRDLSATATLERSPLPGIPGTVDVEILNNSIIPIANVGYSVFLATDSSLNTAVQVIGTGTISNLDPGTVRESVTFEYPDGLEDGRVHHIGVVVDPDNTIAESDESNNVGIAPRSITYQEPNPVDLIFEGSAVLTPGELPLTPGGSIDLSFRVRNAGPEDLTDSVTVGIRFGDMAFQQVATVGPISAGQVLVVDVPFQVPSEFAGASEAILADVDLMLDFAGSFLETDESNNTLALGTVEIIDPASFGKGPPITGSTASETLTGTSDSEDITGLAGDDRINALAGDDLIYGGEGEDSIGGSAGNDSIFGGARDDLIRGGDGNDTIDGGTFSDLIFGDAGDDSIFGNQGNDVVLGRDGNDTIEGGDNRDNLQGEAGNDAIYGGADFDTLGGGDGDDVLYGGDFPDVMRGGIGNDQLFGDGSNDLMFGDAGDDSMFGGLGRDNMVGGTGNDTLDGGADLDKLAGGAGNDTMLGGDAFDRISGQEGDDVLFGGGGRDLLFGGVGNDEMHGNADRDVLLSRDGDDVLYGGDEIDKLYGEDGADAIYGGADTDFIFDGSGNSTAFGGDGRDIVRMGLGDDTAFGGAGDDNLRGEAGNDSILGEGGIDFLLGEAGNDQLDGGADADRLDGGLGNDTLFGGAGADSVSGSNGNDIVLGDDGNDLVRGGVGDDTLIGGTGNDTLIGEAGADRFEFTEGDGADQMLGFGGGDLIQVRALDIDTVQLDQNGRFWRIEYGVTDSIDIRVDAGVDLVLDQNVFIVPLIDELT